MKSFKIIIGICLMLGCQLMTATGVFGQGQKQVYVVLVGVSHYSDSKIDLKYADADANDMYKKLVSMGVPTSNIAVLTNEDATYANIIRTADEQFSKATDKDEVIFFFSGHGGPGFVVPTDEPTMLYYTNLKVLFKNCAANKKVILLDACFAGGLRGPDETAQRKQLEEEHAQMKAAFESDKTIMAFTASRDDQESNESTLYHGYFTRFLIKSFDGLADTNHDGFVSFRELYDYVSGNVKRISHNLQNPVMFGHFDPEGSFFKVMKN